MTAFLIRRLVQMIIIIILSSIVSYGLLYLSPGGPVKCPGPDPRCRHMTADDIARMKARFELDLDLPVRFMRWFIGVPRGPITVGGQELFADVRVGCAVPRLVPVIKRYPDGREVEDVVQRGCEKLVTLADLEKRRSSRGVLFWDFGLSQVILRDQPVSEVIGSRLWYTVALMGISTIITLIIAVPIGVYSAVKQYSRFDYVMTTTAFVGSSLPTFFFGIILILVFAVLAKNADLPYLPPGNATANRDYIIPLFVTELTVEKESLLDYALHFIMPCAVLTFVSIAQWSRFVRSSMLEVLRQEYVRTARAKGVVERLVIIKHAFRNALIPFITLLANILPNLFAGAAITEAVFNWPGLGRLLIDSLERHDYPVALALLYITIILQLVGYLLSDIMYTVADPRIRLS
jgi:peptide/nickel transport system permease protein